MALPTCWRLSKNGLRFEIRAQEDAPPSAELRICYGEDSAAEILAVHGILLEENEADFLELFESPEELQALK